MEVLLFESSNYLFPSSCAIFALQQDHNEKLSLQLAQSSSHTVSEVKRVAWQLWFRHYLLFSAQPSRHHCCRLLKDKRLCFLHCSLLLLFGLSLLSTLLVRFLCSAGYSRALLSYGLEADLLTFVDSCFGMVRIFLQSRLGCVSRGTLLSFLVSYSCSSTRTHFLILVWFAINSFKVTLALIIIRIIVSFFLVTLVIEIFSSSCNILLSIIDCQDPFKQHNKKTRWSRPRFFPAPRYKSHITRTRECRLRQLR